MLFTSCIVVASAKTNYDKNDIIIKDLKMYVQGKEFFVKGINYEPTPLGITKMGNAGLSGGGYCSVRRNYLGNIQSACFLKDYYDGMVNDAVTKYPAPDGPWFEEVWERDLPIIKELGANTIRVYNMQPFTKTLFNKFSTLFGPPLYTYPNQGAEHKPFLDAVHKYGLMAIVPIVSEEETLSLRTDEELYAMIEARVDELGNHPALLMWCIGNNLGLVSKDELRATVNRMIEKVKSYMLEKWNRVVPVTSAESDVPPAYLPLVKDLKIDVFTANVYRGAYLSKFWRPDPTEDLKTFPGWAAISKNYNIPLLLGEFGAHHQEKETQSQQDWINMQIKAMYTARRDGCIGGLFKEYSDQFLAGDGDNDMGVVTFSVSTGADNSTGDSQTPGSFITDTVTKKTTIFTAIQKGLPNSGFTQFSYAGDVFQLTGSAQSVIDPTTIPIESEKPAPSGTIDPIISGKPKPTPGKSNEPNESNSVPVNMIPIPTIVAMIAMVATIVKFLGM